MNTKHKIKKRSVSPAGCLLPVVSYDWLACGTWLEDCTHGYLYMSVNYEWQSVFLFFGTGSLVNELGKQNKFRLVSVQTGKTVFCVYFYLII